MFSFRSFHPLRVRRGARRPLPYFLEGLCAGFPSPADDYLDESIDLNDLLIRNQPATFLWRVDGHSMREAGIFHGDLLVVDRSLAPADGDIVVVIVNGERSLKRLQIRKGQLTLSFENKDYPEGLALHEGDEIEIWGVVRCSIHWHRAGG
ncbi:LexA family protein [Beijerinckia indica]|uniref:Peptidase S24 and S26 domain protein n=1 Tax=Beijerinckia indica subsp. indica (strain ATCC 9039 / DSM 1715 / NCIMB 8712) TaxID=395963 RepID=B2ILA1_BEII9|nr:translesion error-prone DNA polymerase V autoproteolytic subunit [Beijerinckia indica]ACB97301.1 peptidase S24 and S26 domain protein [Beijerinckia indica subsp. indica ATCC 9039]